MSFKVTTSLPARSNNKAISGLVTLQNAVTSSSSTPSSSFITLITSGQDVTGAYLNVQTPISVSFNSMGFGDQTLLDNNSPVSYDPDIMDTFTFTQSGVYDISFSLNLYKANPGSIPTGTLTSAINTQSYMIVSNPDGSLKWRTAGSFNDLFVSDVAYQSGYITNGLYTSCQRAIVKGITIGDTLAVQTKIHNYIFGSDGEYGINQGGTLTILKIQ